MEVEIKYQKNVDYFGLSSDITENQSCACGHCVRGEGLCHCLGNGPEFDAHRCVCLGISCNHKIARAGSSISSAIGGISHGVVDFVVGSLHDLQSAAVYIGSGELEMTLHERAAMIEAVEQSHMQQLATLGSHFMDMLSIDGSDASYQSFRSNTRLGLEVGSLVAGGYGAIKGVIAFNRLARAPQQVAKVVKLSAKTLKSGNGFLGHKGFELKYAPFQTVRNESTIINGRKYTGHALDRMQDRGFMPSIVENTLDIGNVSPNFPKGSKYYDPINRIKVIVSENGEIITVIPGRE